ncbi:hypothetical protein N7448_008911 [Penicillium atrosanguineum]|uniref:MARVEL domain-containing protein n=1 Tax=Penicillium atrosanguineum TaxID=1132637 RepID=A0A9W9KZI2_9EURO|nr:hypothetical protein N7448_008911 [Penicillium atrosanguineum]KAJ5148367.1 hypothetical protein N7526_001719 [Penicillium atrosanguineum]KAJ5330281.1 hypothetical protein N7476_000064 [Penicillium atrosanguineum]
MSSTIPFLTEGQLRFFLICNRVIQWLSSVVVLGITSYFINTGPRGLTIVYVEVIAAVSVVAFLPSFVSPFMATPAKDFVLFIDVIFSYLWLAAFIFSAVDYNQHNCHANAPPGVSCSKKWANEAFVFLTFIFTFFALFIEAWSLWLARRDNTHSSSLHEKSFRSASEPNSAVHATQAPAEEPMATPAQVV